MGAERVCVHRTLFAVFFAVFAEKNSKKCTMYQSNAQYPNKQGIELEDYAII